MRRVGRSLLGAGLLGLAAVVVLPNAALSAELSVRATIDPARVGVGEAAELVVEIEGAQNVPPPEIADTGGLTIQYLGPATQVSIVNGRMSATVTHRYSVVAPKPGSFSIGPITLEHAGKHYDAGSVKLEVRNASAGAVAESSGANPPGLRLELSASKSEVYLGERVPLIVKLSIGVRASDVQYPNLGGDGFALDKFPEPAQRRQQTSEGVFQVIEFRTVLTALRAGSLTVGPATTRLNVVVRGRGGQTFGQLFGGTLRSTELRSEPLRLTVLPLPEAGRPPDFSGAVGRFELEVRAAPVEVTAGDPVTITSTIRGEGNLESLSAPAIQASDSLRVYPVEPARAPVTSQGQAVGSPGERKFEQVVIPKVPGSTTIPELRLSYFDPDAHAYRTVTQPPIALTVLKPAQAGSTITGAGLAPAKPESLGRDIVFIKDSPGSFRETGSRLYRRAGFWAWQLVPVAAWMVAAVWDRRRRRLTGDLRYARFTRAGREARQGVARAREALSAGDQTGFYDTLARAMSDYLSAKLDLPPGDVTPASASGRLSPARLASDLTRDLEQLFASCEHARFAPAQSSATEMQEALDRFDAIVRALERERTLRRSMAAGVVLALASSAWLVCGAWAAATASEGEAPNTIFFHANTLYNEERYADAATEYQRVLAAGHESGALYFNLGNAYFKLGDTGRAILSYERARRFLPRDADLIANLGYARTQVGEWAGEPLYARLLFPLADRVTSDDLLLAASIIYGLLALALVAVRLTGAMERPARAVVVITGLILVLLLSSAAYRLITLDLPSFAVVVSKQEATVRFEPSPGGTVHFQSKPGEVLRVLAEREGWAQVARRDGLRGWIEQGALEVL